MKDPRFGLRAIALIAALVACFPVLPNDPVPTAQPDAAAMWQEFLAREDAIKAYDAYELLDTLGYDLHQVDAEACREHADALAEGVRRASVSIALRHVAVLCAEATGDAALAGTQGEVLEALSRHALAQASDVSGAIPIRVMSAQDAFSLIAGMGLESTYQYYIGSPLSRYLPFVAVAWDPEARVERHMTFDNIDTMNAIVRTDPYSGYPFQRTQLSQAILESQAKSDIVMGVDLLATRDSYSQSSVAAKAAKLRPAAELGGIHAAATWLNLCESKAAAGCADGLVDALLPAAEQRRALPMALLAYAHANGIGVERDEAAAIALLDAADRRWPRAGASAYYASYWLLRHPGDIPSFVQARIDAAMAAGNPNMRNVVLLRTINGATPSITPDDIAHLSSARYNQRGTGFALIAASLAKSGDQERARGFWQRAADAGDADAQAEVALSAMRGDQANRDKARERSLLEQAAHGGSASAARMLAYTAGEAGKWEEAMAWLYAPLNAGDIPALLDAGRIYEYERPGFTGEVGRAVRVYTSLADQNDVPEARRRLAVMAVQGRGMEKDASRARAWLMKDAERDDHESQALLGSLYLSGDFGKVDEAQGRAWLEKAMQGGEGAAFSGFGHWLVNNKDTPESRREGLAVLGRGVDAGDVTSMNNLAWALCTSHAEDIRDPARGVEVGARMGVAEDLDPGTRDTVAACHAAKGDFAAAVRLQRTAVDDFQKYADAGGERGKQDMTETLKRARGRLALYEAGKPYIETNRD
jgi:TPR repeat protein